MIPTSATICLLFTLICRCHIPRVASRTRLEKAQMPPRRNHGKTYADRAAEERFFP